MTDESKEKALTEFLKNPYWKGIYDKAPEKVKRLYELSFARAENLISADEDKAATESLYKEFDDSDWDYLIENTESNMARWGYRQARALYLKNPSATQP